METSSLTPGQQMSNTLDISVDEARDLTKLIKGKLEGILDQVYEVHQLMLKAHDRKAWQALGYPTWQQYVKKEFNLSRSRSYQLLDRARVQQALLAAGVGATAMSSTPWKYFWKLYAPDEAVTEEFSLPQVEAPSHLLPAPSFNMSARAVQNLKPQLPQAEADVKKLVQEGAPIEHAVQTVIDQYGRAIDEEINQQSENGENRRAYDYDLGVRLALDIGLFEKWVQHSPEELTSGLRAAGKVRQARASLDKTLLVLLELQKLLQRRGVV
jgi:hypothetical protein